MTVCRLNKFLCVSFVFLLSNESICAQDILKDIFWTRVSEDSSGKRIDERTNHFDVHSFSFERKDKMRYWPLAPCYLSSGLLGEYEYSQGANQIKFDFYRYPTTLIDSIYDSTRYSKSYRIELIVTTEFRDTSMLDYEIEFANSWGLTRVDYLLQLLSMDDEVILRYEGLRYERDKAFKKMSHYIRKVSRKRNREQKRERMKEDREREREWKRMYKGKK